MGAKVKCSQSHPFRYWRPPQQRKDLYWLAYPAIPSRFLDDMFTAKDAQLIQEVDEHGVPSTDPTDNRIEDTWRRSIFDMKARSPDAQTTLMSIIDHGGSDAQFDAYAETLRNNKFDVQLEHGYRPGEPGRFHRFIIDWHYSLTGGKLY